MVVEVLGLPVKILAKHMSIENALDLTWVCLLYTSDAADE